MAGLIIFLSLVGLVALFIVIMFLADRSDGKLDARRSDIKALRKHVHRAEGALDDIELALGSYAGLDIVGNALAQDVRNIIRNHRQDTRKIEEKRNK